MTALSLETPVCSSELEHRMLGPIIERIWGGYVPLDYAAAARTGTLPPNVEVSEFFCKAGAFMGNDFICSRIISARIIPLPPAMSLPRALMLSEH